MGIDQRINYQNMARKKIEKLEFKVFTRIGREKYKELDAMLKNSRYRTMSALIRDVLMNQKITILTRDSSLDELMERLISIRTELTRIGVNMNLATRGLYQNPLPQEQLDIALEVTRFKQQSDERVRELFELISKLSYKWLPE